MARAQTLVLIPGFMADASLWDGVVEALGDGVPIVHADLTRNDSIPAMAERIVAGTPGPFVAVGFSMGGYVAREAARIAPDRVRGLALVATSARDETPERARLRREGAERAASARFAGLSRATVAASLHPDREADEGLIARVRDMGARLGGEVFVRQSRLPRPGDLDRLGAIRCPTLVVAAAQDRVRSLAESEELRDRIPGASLRVIEGSGHMLPIEAPAALAATLRAWLAAL